MHYLTYVVIDHTELPENYEDDDIEYEVRVILERYGDGHEWDWYEIGGRWADNWPDNRMTVAKYLTTDMVLPHKYFDHNGEFENIDLVYKILPYVDYKYYSPEFIAIQERIKACMLAAIKACHPKDLIIIVDLHN